MTLKNNPTIQHLSRNFWNIKVWENSYQFRPFLLHFFGVKKNLDGPVYRNCSVPCIFTLLHSKMWYYSLKDNLKLVKNNLWGTPQGLRVVHLVDTVISLLYSLVCIEHGYSAYCCVGAGSSPFTQSSLAPLLEAVEAGQRRRKVTFY